MTDWCEVLLGVLMFVLIACIGLLIYSVYDDARAFDAMTVPTPIDKALQQDVGTRVYIAGTVQEFDKEEIRHWILFIPMMISTGKTSTMILLPIPMTDVDYIYKVTDETGSVPVKFNSHQTIGSVVGFKGHIKKAEGAGTKYIG